MKTVKKFKEEHPELDDWQIQAEILKRIAARSKRKWVRLIARIYRRDSDK